MAFKLLITLALVAYATAQSYQSNKYPAGVHPQLCPHYPYCDNVVLAGFAQGVASIHHGGLAAPGYPAGLSPHACPNYPYCSHEIPQEAIHYRRSPQNQYQHQPFAAASHVPYPIVASLGSPSPAKYPSGVDPASCPNYPYCH